MAYAKIRPRRGTATQWETANPILVEGEIGVEVPDDGVGTGTVNIKFGDGVTPWNDLPYGIATVALNANLGMKNLKTYTALSQLGLESADTLESIIAVLPEASEIIIGAGSGTDLVGALPMSGRAGELRISKITSYGGGRGTAEWRQLGANSVWTNSYTNGAFVGWERKVLNSDLAKYLLLTGGKLSGNLSIEHSDATQSESRVINSLGDGVLCVSKLGEFGLYDVSHSKWLTKSDADGNVTFDGKMQKLQTMTELAHIGCGTDNTITEIMTALPKYTEMITGTSATVSNLNTSLGIGGAAGILICRKFGANRGEVIWRRTHSPSTIHTWGWHEGTLSNQEQIALKSDTQRGSGSVTIVSPTTTPSPTEITFENEFSSVPTVMIDSQHRHLLSVSDVTKTGFKVYGMNTELSQISGTFTWVAFG